MSTIELQAGPPPIQVEIVNIYQVQVAEPAGFWIRLAAYTLDLIILNIVAFPVGFVVAFVRVIKYGPDIHHHASTVGAIVGLIVGILYAGFLESSPWQATPGKRACGVVVQKPNGDRISFADAVGRYLAKFLSIFVLCIGFFMIAFTKEKTGLHDLLANTRVVYGRRG